METEGTRATTDYSNLFGWWISSITFNILFVIFASVYLYRRRNRQARPKTGSRIVDRITDFVFVWILLALLVLYVVSIGEGSYLLFAAGNIVVQIILVTYVVHSHKSPSSSSQTSR